MITPTVGGEVEGDGGEKACNFFFFCVWLCQMSITLMKHCEGKGDASSVQTLDLKCRAVNMHSL